MSKEILKEEAPSPTPVVSPDNRRFGTLRSVQWRINLGILPSSSPSSSSASASSVDDLRRITADSRRRYAGLRRRLLVDQHIPKDAGSNSPDLVMDNPLSQNPDSTWGRFFRNAELEKMVDQDLSRLYPEHGSYFQTPGCQGMLRRILLLWCLRHPECGYRQGMHELLAPLLYVLHVDVERLSEVRKLYEDHFTDKFDELSFEENDVTYNFDFKKFLDPVEDDMGSQGNSKKVRSLEDLEPEIQTIVLLSDAYGAEGELGIVLSEKFMEHDAYCMFDALMTGAHGAVAMADFFAPPAAESHCGLPPVIETSAALYHLLSIVDSSLHSHLVDLGIEPQYFALRWLRVLFEREFSLENLLVIWDEIFTADNRQLNVDSKDEESSSFKILHSHRGALISAMAVSMILYMRSSLLATEHATTCLQRLLNFPESIDLKKLIAKAKSLQIIALDFNVLNLSSTFGGAYDHSKSAVVRGHSLSSDPVSPKTPLSLVPDSYWEEKWRVLHKAEELRQDSLGKQSPSGKKRWSEKVKLTLSRTESDPSPARANKKVHRSAVRRSLLDDLSRQLGLEKDAENGCSLEASKPEGHDSVDVHQMDGQDVTNNETICDEERCESGSGTVISEENSSIFSNPASPGNVSDDHENDTEKSSVASNSSIDENDDLEQINEEPPLPVSLSPQEISLNSLHEKESSGKMVSTMKERKNLPGRFQWFWKFGRNNVSDETADKAEGAHAAAKSPDHDSKINAAGSSTAGASRNTSSTSKVDTVDQNVMGTLKNLGNSMLEHIQVIESVFQQDHQRGQVGSVDNFSKNNIVGKGQVTAMTALKELRKISNLLSEM